MISLERIIWPIGHGAFYTEQFKDENGNVIFTAVYDCGSYQLRKLQKCIDEFLQNNKISHIDALFISHFHYDHVNALDYLLSKVHIRELFIPQLTDDYILSVLGTNLYERIPDTQGNYLEILQRLYNREGIENVDMIFEVPQIDGENLPEEEYREQDFRGEFKYAKAPLKYQPIPLWLYLPCNIFSPSKTLVDTFIANNYGDNKGNVDINLVFNDLQKGYWKKIQGLYEIVFSGDHNNYSMTLYSGFHKNVTVNSIQSNVYARPLCLFGCHLCGTIHPILSEDVGCIYMGDFTKQYISQLKRFYYQNHLAWRRAKMFQIPHHGSYYNYDAALYDFPKLSFASAAVRDRDGHPHIQTISEITSKGCPVVIVQDIKATALIITYTFS